MIKKFVLIAILFLCLFSCKTVDINKTLDITLTTIQATEKAARPISDEEEYYIGRAVAARMFLYYTLYENHELTNYINSIGKVIALHSEKPFTFGGYHFALLNSNEINAFACPGGIVFLTKGMLKLAKSEDELAAIIAHEIAHVNHRDGINSIKQARWTEALTIIGTTAAKQYGDEDLLKLVNIFENSIDDILKTLIVNGYSKTQEYAADEKALQYLAKAGYNPYAVLNVLERLRQSTKSEGGILNTHPDTTDRINNLKDKIPVVSLDLNAFKKRSLRFNSFVKE
ncbi:MULTISPECIES: M48 family metalloprotease [Thermodesulfovibrio]|uniref:Peptidase M48 n=1 Tax=Thermodesulfovibrio yellowstonii TaxID=28262 RepID=A0A9W6GH65_9BACT|nr:MULTISPECIES: M48 family metalloprotease [Thermodesulfovibrio]MDI6865342.1 M48 family metalloprotease [Thermodesulfovibrio yellowstonii]GLI53834.1 peptidase M48 [Thermodesulfovibrio islandicus]